MGLLSPGGVHSLEDHLFELLTAAYEFGIKKVSVHCFGDGRDVAPESIKPSLEKLQNLCDKYGYHIASLAGRFYAMDRDKMFDRVEKAYDALLGKSNTTFKNAIDYVDLQYKNGITDEFLVLLLIESLSKIHLLKIMIQLFSLIFVQIEQDN